MDSNMEQYLVDENETPHFKITHITDASIDKYPLSKDHYFVQVYSSDLKPNEGIQPHKLVFLSAKGFPFLFILSRIYLKYLLRNTMLSSRFEMLLNLPRTKLQRLMKVKSELFHISKEQTPSSQQEERVTLRISNVLNENETHYSNHWIKFCSQSSEGSPSIGLIDLDNHNEVNLKCRAQLIGNCNQVEIGMNIDGKKRTEKTVLYHDIISSEDKSNLYYFCIDMGMRIQAKFYLEASSFYFKTNKIYSDNLMQFLITKVEITVKKKNDPQVLRSDFRRTQIAHDQDRYTDNYRFNVNLDPRVRHQTRPHAYNDTGNTFRNFGFAQCDLKIKKGIEALIDSPDEDQPSQGIGSQQAPDVVSTNHQHNIRTLDPQLKEEFYEKKIESSFVRNEKNLSGHPSSRIEFPETQPNPLSQKRMEQANNRNEEYRNKFKNDKMESKLTSKEIKEMHASNEQPHIDQYPNMSSIHPTEKKASFSGCQLQYTVSNTSQREGETKGHPQSGSKATRMSSFHEISQSHNSLQSQQSTGGQITKPKTRHNAQNKRNNHQSYKNETGLGLSHMEAKKIDLAVNVNFVKKESPLDWKRRGLPASNKF